MDHKGVNYIAYQKEAGKNKAQLLSAEMANEPGEDGYSHEGNRHVQHFGE